MAQYLNESLEPMAASNFGSNGHNLNPAFLAPLVLTLLVLLPSTWFLCSRVREDYHAFLALGPGGTPSTFTGYIRICMLRVGALKDPFTPPAPPPGCRSTSAHLQSLPRRNGTRPSVAGIAPQRQLDQTASEGAYNALCSVIEELEKQRPENFFTGTSCFEKHSIALFSKILVDGRMTCNGEICHTHSSDGSLHLTLHSADIKIVLDQGWGQRHPLARDPGSWWWWLRLVPTGFVLVYAPRDQTDLKVVADIIEAAAWWFKDAKYSDIRANRSCTGANIEAVQEGERVPEHGWKRLFEGPAMMGNK